MILILIVLLFHGSQITSQVDLSMCGSMAPRHLYHKHRHHRVQYTCTPLTADTTLSLVTYKHFPMILLLLAAFLILTVWPTKTKWTVLSDGEEAHLILNIDMTKELTIDFKRKEEEATPILIERQTVEVVPSYKYLGFCLDNKLDWKENARVTMKRALSRLFFLRKLRSFKMSCPLLNIFYHGILANVVFLCCCLLGWQSVSGGQEQD